MNLAPISLAMALLLRLPLPGFGADLQARFEKSLNEAKALANVQIEFQDTLWMPRGFDTKGTEFSRTFQYSYVTSGPKFRARCKLISASQTNLVKLRESVFDGDLHTSYLADTGYMTRSRAARPGAGSESSLNPLIGPFLFLPRKPADCMECMLRFTEIVSDVSATDFILPPGKIIDGLLEITLPGLPSAKQPTHWKIAMSEHGDAFTPERITSVTSSPETRLEVVHRLLSYTNLGGFPFPSRIEWAMTSHPPSGPPTVLSTGLVTVLSARLPDHTSDSVFQLSDQEKSAEVIWNWDTKNFAKEAGADSKPAESSKKRTKIYDESLDGAKQITSALAIARKENKHVLLQFGANWCGWCHLLHKLFETNEAIDKRLDADFVVVLIDVNQGHNKDIDTKYGQPTRFGLPVIVVLDSDGRQLTTKNTGELEKGKEHDPDKVLAFLKEWAPKR